MIVAWAGSNIFFESDSQKMVMPSIFSTNLTDTTPYAITISGSDDSEKIKEFNKINKCSLWRARLC